MYLSKTFLGIFLYFSLLIWLSVLYFSTIILFLFVKLEPELTSRNILLNSFMLSARRSAILIFSKTEQFSFRFLRRSYKLILFIYASINTFLMPLSWPDSNPLIHPCFTPLSYPWFIIKLFSIMDPRIFPCVTPKLKPSVWILDMILFALRQFLWSSRFSKWA